MFSLTSNLELERAVSNNNLKKVKHLLEHGADANGKPSGRPVLATAASKGQTKIIEQLLKHGAQVDLQTYSERSPLTFASENGHTEAMKLLLKHRAQVDLQDKDGQSPLMYASKQGNIKAIQLLLKHGAQVNLEDKDGKSPLVYARYGGTKVMQLLLEHGAQVDLQNKDGKSPLEYAIEQGETYAMQLLLEHGAQVDLQDKDGNSPLVYASRKWNTRPMQLLLEHGAQVDLQDKDGKFPMEYAIDIWNTEAIKLLLKHGAQVNLQDKDGISLLAKAIGHTEVMQMLLEHGAQVDLQDKDGKSPLVYAIEQGETYAMQLLLEHGAQVDLQDKDGNFPLVYASRKWNTRPIQLLLEHGAQVDLQDKDGKFPMEYAIDIWNTEAIKLLLKHGAQVNLQDKDGNFLLARAIGHTEVMQLLLEHRAQLDLQDKDGKSPLAWASTYGHTEAVQLLLEHGAQVDLQDKDGKSPLIYASRNGMTKTMQLLLEHGAQVDLQDKDGQSPLVYASKFAKTQAMQLLLKHGAQIDLQNNNGNSLLLLACNQSEWTLRIEALNELLYLLMKHGAQVNLRNNDGNSPLLVACATEYNIGIVALLLKNGAHVDMQNNEGKTPLMVVIDSELDTAPNTVELLLNHGTNINLQDNRGRTALMLACQNRSLRDINPLLSYSLDIEIDLQDKEGWSALMLATQSGDTLKVQHLLERNASLSLRNRQGLTALMVACQKGYLDIVEIFLYNKAEVDLTDNMGRSALMHATEGGHLLAARFLVEHGACIDIQDNKGCTPLMVACQNRHKDLVSALLNSGAFSTTLQNNSGKTAFDIALNSNSADILEQFTALRTRPSFPGIWFWEGVKKVTLTSSAKSINLNDVGISLSFPEDALSSTDPLLDIQIQPCFSGSWEVPENLELVSPAYIIKPSREVVFRKEVLVKIWHHTNLETEEDCKSMVFLSASTSPEYRDGSPVYVFREIESAKASFRPRVEQPIGEIKLKHFCIAIAARKRSREWGDSYSARLYRSKEKKTIIFCMCLSQPEYIKRCDTAIITEYKIQEEGKHPLVEDEVTITAEEVSVNQKCTREWTTFYRKKPASISKEAIAGQKKYKPNDGDNLTTATCIPRIEIEIKKCPCGKDSEQILELKVEGLNREPVFKISPGDFPSLGVDTSKIKTTMEELQEEIKEGLCQSGGSNSLSIATQMLEKMECVEKILESQDPVPLSDVAIHMLQEMEEKSRLLKDETNRIAKFLKVTYDMEVYVEAVCSFSLQLKMIYSANINSSLKTGNTSEWEAATLLFVTNAANLMTSIKKVLKASRSAQALPNNCLPSDTSQLHVHGYPPPTVQSYPLPHSDGLHPSASVQFGCGYNPPPSLQAAPTLSPSPSSQFHGNLPRSLPYATQPTMYSHPSQCSSQLHWYPFSPSQITSQTLQHGHSLPSQATPLSHPPSPSSQATHTPQPQNLGYTLDPSPFSQLTSQPLTTRCPASPLGNTSTAQNKHFLCRTTYFGREAPIMKELCTAVVNCATGKKFNLTNHISGSWKVLGLTLGMEFDFLGSIGSRTPENTERLMTVFSHWLENAAGLPHHARYPLSWQGLYNLLEDMGKMEVAKQYFEFLDHMTAV